MTELRTCSRRSVHRSLAGCGGGEHSTSCASSAHSDRHHFRNRLVDRGNSHAGSGRVLFSWLKRRHRMKTEGPWELGDLLEGQNLVWDLIARGGSLHQVLDTLLRVIQL